MPKCCREERQEPAFSTRREPPGQGIPGEAGGEGWGRGDGIPAFFLPSPQAEDPGHPVPPTRGSGDSRGRGQGWHG